mmetsp:Transcript_5054/g.18187  ORF Transcript_5054/g.18187 Transcript_5054/m.18187 type:complete len:89 (-) Transcript_5054:1535-1801(-)
MIPFVFCLAVGPCMYTCMSRSLSARLVSFNEGLAVRFILDQCHRASSCLEPLRAARGGGRRRDMARVISRDRASASRSVDDVIGSFLV